MNIISLRHTFNAVHGSLQCASFSTQFRKRLGVYSFKLKKGEYYDNTHPMRIRTQENLRKLGDKGWRKIREKKRNSYKPFGIVSSKGKFTLHYDKVPFYNIPDLDGFNLKPYVSHVTPPVPESSLVKKEIAITEEVLQKINIDLKKHNFQAGKAASDPLSQLQNK